MGNTHEGPPIVEDSVVWRLVSGGDRSSPPTWRFECDERGARYERLVGEPGSRTFGRTFTGAPRGIRAAAVVHREGRRHGEYFVFTHPTLSALGGDALFDALFVYNPTTPTPDAEPTTVAPVVAPVGHHRPPQQQRGGRTHHRRTPSAESQKPGGAPWSPSAYASATITHDWGW